MSSEIYELAFKSSAIGVFVLDASGNIIEANDQMHRIFGYEVPGLAGMPLEQLLPHDVRATHRLHRKKYMKSPTRRNMGDKKPFKALRADGSEVFVEVGLAYINTGNEDLIVANVTDVTDKIALVEQSRKYREEKIRSDAEAKAKSDFLANMSHDIRTPLHAITGLSHLISETDNFLDQRQYLRQLTLSSALLKEIVDDVLDFSKLEANHVDLHPENTSLNGILEHVASVSTSALMGKDVGFVVIPEPRVDDIFVDHVQLIRVLMNLVSNATKFTQKGRVVLSASLIRETSAGRTIRFEVSDTGIGIPQKDLGRVFSPFEQVMTKAHKQHVGTGLGLAICVKLLDLMGSKLQVDSISGKGSNFWFDLDIPGAVASQVPSPSSIARHVMVIDNDPEMLRAMSKTVEAIGWSVDVRTSGQSAIDGFSEMIASRRSVPDLILLGHLSGEMEVELTCKRIRALLGVVAPPLCMMIRPEKKAVTEGLKRQKIIDADIIKPVLPSTLKILGESVFGKTYRSHVWVTGSGSTDTNLILHGTKILVIDDNDVNRLIAQRILEKAGAQVIGSENGLAGLGILGRKGPFDLVMLDLQMPGIDGFEVARRIRKDDRFKSLPILAFTAGVLEEQRRAALDAGMDGFIPKPFNVEKTIDTIHRLTRVNDRYGAVSLNRQDGVEYPGLCVTHGLSIVEDEVFYKKLLILFQKQHQDAVALMHQSDNEGGVALCHKLQGIALNLGFTDLYEATQRIIAHCGEDEGRIALFSEFKSAFDTLMKSIDAYVVRKGEYSEDVMSEIQEIELRSRA